MKKAISESISKLEFDLVNFPGQLAFYKYVNSKFGQSNRQPMCIKNDKGNYVTDSMLIAQTFNTEFARNSLHTSLTTTAINLGALSGQPLFNISFQDTFTALKAAPNSAPAPDGIPGFPLRLPAPSLALPLSRI